MSYLDHDENRGVGRWAAVAASGMAARFLGASLVIPLALSGLSYYLLRKFRKDPVSACAMESLALGQVGWFALGIVAMPAMWSSVLPDMLIMVVLILWLLLRLSSWPVAVMMGFEVLALIANGISIAAVDLMSEPFKALLIHILWRGLTIAAACIYLVRDRKHAQNPENPTTIEVSEAA